VGRLRSFARNEGYYDLSADGMQRSVEQSLEALGLSTLDIFFLHDSPMIEEANVAQVIETMLALKEKGYTKKIGIGGNPPAWLFSDRFW
jgi:aryl-alcohol dehydrogenase-like predicted oxidoreductase